MKEAASVAERASVLMMLIFKGDDTGGTFGRHFAIKVDTEEDLTGCVVVLEYQGFTKRFEGIVAGQNIEVFFSHKETREMKVGIFNAVLAIIDQSGKVRTLANTIPVKVTTNVDEVYGTEGQEISVKFSTVLSWHDIVDKPTLNGNVLDGDMLAHGLGLANLEDVPDFKGEMIPLFTDDELREALKKVIVILGGQTNI